VQESARIIKAIRLPAAAIGLLAGFGTAYLACFFVERAAGPPLIYYGLMVILLPFIVIGVTTLLLWIRKPLPASDARMFVLYFWIPFFTLYVATTILYWAARV